MADCLFCKIARREIPAALVYEDERVIAFNDINPQAPTHVLVVPKEHHANVAHLSADAPETLVQLFESIRAVADSEGLGDRFRLVFNTGPEAGQSVFHVHAHVLGGRPMGWPPG